MNYDFHKSHAWKSDPDDLFMDNVYAFRDIVNLYSHGIDFYFPNYRDAPWQVQAEISGEKINFWPHLPWRIAVVWKVEVNAVTVEVYDVAECIDVIHE